MASILVTGGSGFVGSHAILQLLEAGHAVRTTVRSLSSAEKVREPLRASGVEPDDRLSFVAADLLDDAGWDEAAQGRRRSRPWGTGTRPATSLSTRRAGRIWTAGRCPPT